MVLAVGFLVISVFPLVVRQESPRNWALAISLISGLVGLVVLLVNTLRVLRPRRQPVGEAAFLIFVFICLFALTSVFWVAGTVTLPMLMIGLSVGDETSEAKRRSSASATTG